ncbi:MAG: cytochrome c biogenesis protein ResB [Thermoanaerobacterales bacterium]|nr:cytochrome c biogenesis protein ResB [Thermoanaerobacterales bacterium]
MEILKKVYRYLSSMKTGLVLLVLVGAAAALGSAFLPDVFFNTWLFKLLLIILSVNMVLCTANRFILFKSRLIKNSNRWLREIGSMLLHAGIVFILAGLLVHAFYGQNAQIAIRTGDTVDVSQIITMKEPFSLHLDDFKVEFNEDGSPSQFNSYVTVLENGVTKDDAVISVNHPLNYRGVKFYQQSYGYLIKAKYTNDTGSEVEELIKEGNFINPEGTGRTVKVFRYIPNFDPNHGMATKTLRPDNPRIIFSVYENEQLLGVGAAQFDERVKIDENVYVVFAGVEPYTILKAKSDPGLPLALFGGGMFVIGVTIALLAAPSQGKKIEGSFN